jgi:hypothetical protein
MGLDWILLDSSEDVLDTFRGKGITSIASIPSNIKDLCYGDEGDELSREARDQIRHFLQKLLESSTLSDFQYEDEEAVTEKEMLETKAFIGDAIAFLENCEEDQRIVCWY